MYANKRSFESIDEPVSEYLLSRIARYLILPFGEELCLQRAYLDVCTEEGQKLMVNSILQTKKKQLEKIIYHAEKVLKLNPHHPHNPNNQEINEILEFANDTLPRIKAKLH